MTCNCRSTAARIVQLRRAGAYK